jgi:hypothetical protein
MKKECVVDMCVKFSASDRDTSGQNRHCVDEIRDREAAIFSSMVWLIWFSDASSSTVKLAAAGADLAGTDPGPEIDEILTRGTWDNSRI